MHEVETRVEKCQNFNGIIIIMNHDGELDGFYSSSNRITHVSAHNVYIQLVLRVKFDFRLSMSD